MDEGTTKDDWAIIDKNRGFGRNVKKGRWGEVKWGKSLFVVIMARLCSVKDSEEKKSAQEKKGAPVKLECWDPEYHHLNGPPPVHAEVEFEESKPKPISATFSSFWANGL